MFFLWTCGDIVSWPQKLCQEIVWLNTQPSCQFEMTKSMVCWKCSLKLICWWQKHFKWSRSIGTWFNFSKKWWECVCSIRNPDFRPRLGSSWNGNHRLGLTFTCLGWRPGRLAEGFGHLSICKIAHFMMPFKWFLIIFPLKKAVWTLPIEECHDEPEDLGTNNLRIWDVKNAQLIRRDW